MTERSDDWYKDAIIYAVDVDRFQDSDGDGIGDFPGLTQRLDYLADLGVTCLWLLPFYPTPNRDNGYDITDFRAVDPRLGTLADFDAFMREAAGRGIRVLLDLVVHHTSDQHPWFRRSRADRSSPYRDYYVWTDRPPAQTRAKLIFPGVEESVWAYDEAAGAYYLHQFYAFQPDLNIEHPPVRDEIRRIVDWWLRRGATGFRIDAAPHLLGTEALDPRRTSQPHKFLRELRRCVDATRPAAALLGETDAEPDDLLRYFGDGDELHLLLNFLLANYTFLALAREEAEPLVRGLRLLPQKPPVGQWATFLRNLDELDLERLSDVEREEVYRAFAPEERMRAYGHGIRRRLAPMLGGDQRRLELAFSLLLSAPGSPVLVYGDEIGMGDDLARPERDSVRAPMQWSREPNAGFSTAPPDRLVQPAIVDGPFGYRRVNVAAQERDPESLLNRLRRGIAARKTCTEFGRGTHRVIGTDHPAALAHGCDCPDGAVIAVHNLSGQPCAAQLDLPSEEVSHLTDVFADRPYPSCGEAGRVELGPYGHRWLRLGRRAVDAG